MKIINNKNLNSYLVLILLVSLQLISVTNSIKCERKHQTRRSHRKLHSKIKKNIIDDLGDMFCSLGNSFTKLLDSTKLSVLKNNYFKSLWLDIKNSFNVSANYDEQIDYIINNPISTLFKKFHRAFFNKNQPRLKEDIDKDLKDAINNAKCDLPKQNASKQKSYTYKLNSEKLDINGIMHKFNYEGVDSLTDKFAYSNDKTVIKEVFSGFLREVLVQFSPIGFISTLDYRLRNSESKTDTTEALQKEAEDYIKANHDQIKDSTSFFLNQVVEQCSSDFLDTSWFINFLKDIFGFIKGDFKIFAATFGYLEGYDEKVTKAAIESVNMEKEHGDSEGVSHFVNGELVQSRTVTHEKAIDKIEEQKGIVNQITFKLKKTFLKFKEIIGGIFTSIKKCMSNLYHVKSIRQSSAGSVTFNTFQMLFGKVLDSLTNNIPIYSQIKGVLTGLLGIFYQSEFMLISSTIMSQPGEVTPAQGEQLGANLGKYISNNAKAAIALLNGEFVLDLYDFVVGSSIIGYNLLKHEDSKEKQRLAKINNVTITQKEIFEQAELNSYTFEKFYNNENLLKKMEAEREALAKKFE